MSTHETHHLSHAVVELRQYTLHPGRREELIALFDREFVETQEAAGMTVVAQFRDLDDPDRFVWLRGFANMPARARALAAFYDGPVWRAHRDAANATMVDSDDVRLLRPVECALMPIDTWRRGRETPQHGAVLALIATMPLSGDSFTAAVDRARANAIAQAGGELVARYVTEPAVNDFPRLPVREGESVAVWLLRTADDETCAQLAAALTRLSRALEPTRLLRLAPTARSRF